MVSLPRLNREPIRLTTQAKRRTKYAPLLPRAFVPGERSTFRWWWRVTATGSTAGHTAVVPLRRTQTGTPPQTGLFPRAKILKRE